MEYLNQSQLAADAEQNNGSWSLKEKQTLFHRIANLVLSLTKMQSTKYTMKKNLHSILPGTLNIQTATSANAASWESKQSYLYWNRSTAIKPNSNEQQKSKKPNNKTTEQ